MVVSGTRIDILPPSGTYSFIYGPPPAALVGHGGVSLPNPAYWCSTSYDSPNPHGGGLNDYAGGYAAITCQSAGPPASLRLTTYAPHPTLIAAIGFGNNTEPVVCGPFSTAFGSTSGAHWPVTQTDPDDHGDAHNCCPIISCRLVLGNSSCSGTSVPSSWVLKNHATGATVSSGTSTGSTTIGLPGTGNYDFTTTYSNPTSPPFPACNNYVMDLTPVTKNFSIVCEPNRPATVGVPQIPKITSFSRTINFQPSLPPTPPQRCPDVNFCSTFFGNLTITACSASGNVGKAAAFVGVTGLVLDNLTPSTNIDVSFKLEVLYAGFAGSPPCPVAGTICKTYTGDCTVPGIDPCTTNCTISGNIPVIMG